MIMRALEFIIGGRSLEKDGVNLRNDPAAVNQFAAFSPFPASLAGFSADSAGAGLSAGADSGGSLPFSAFSAG